MIDKVNEAKFYIYIYIYTHTHTHVYMYLYIFWGLGILFSCQVMSDSLQLHELQHARLPCPLLSPGVCLSSCPLSWWCHLTITSILCGSFFCHSTFPSIRVFSNGLALHIRWPEYWSFNISPSNEYSGLISFRIDWFDPLAVEGTLKSLLQQHSWKASIFQGSAFFMVQLSHL